MPSVKTNTAPSISRLATNSPTRKSSPRDGDAASPADGRAAPRWKGVLPSLQTSGVSSSRPPR
jgi:hypothetical protein